MVKSHAPHDFDRVKIFQNIARQPDIAVSTTANEAQQLVIRDDRGAFRLRGGGGGYKGFVRRQIVPSVGQGRFEPLFLLFQLPPMPAEGPREGAWNFDERND